MNILESLKEGPKLYNELRGSMSAMQFDIQLEKLVREKAVILVPYFTGARYSLPFVPPQDRPFHFAQWKPRPPDPRKGKRKKPLLDRKTCTVCGIEKDKEDFSLRGSWRYNACKPCRLTARRAKVARGGKW